jgi:hypothetical protein
MRGGWDTGKERTTTKHAEDANGEGLSQRHRDHRGVRDAQHGSDCRGYKAERKRGATVVPAVSAGAGDEERTEERARQ